MSTALAFLEKFSSRLALIEDGNKYSYQDLCAQVRVYKDLLFTLRVSPGDVIALSGDYTFKNISLFLALYLNKNIIVPISEVITEPQVKKLELVSPKVLFSQEKGEINAQVLTQASVEEHPLLVDFKKEGHAGLILFSSGTTGSPKVMLHNLDGLFDKHFGKQGKEIRILLFLLFDHIAGIDTLIRGLSVGATLVIPPSRQAFPVCQTIEQHKVKVLPVSPTFLNLLYLSGALDSCDLSSLKIIAFGAEAMPDYLLSLLKQKSPSVCFQQKFGTSETNAITIKNKPGNELYFKIVDPDVENKVLDGELWIRSKHAIKGYIQSQDETFTPDGWFKTGDLVSLDEEGYLRIVGRKKEMINVGGEKVLPSEVENVVLQLPQVDDCIAYGAPNMINGESVALDVILNHEYSNLKRSEVKLLVQEACRKQLDMHKVPTRVSIKEAFDYGTRFKKKRSMQLEVV